MYCAELKSGIIIQSSMSVSVDSVTNCDKNWIVAILGNTIKMESQYKRSEDI